MEIKGRVLQLLPITTGQGKKGQWKKQDFVIETQAQYPKKVCLSLWGEKVDQYNLQIGEMVNVSVDLESREYNGRWYTEARAWKLEKQGNGGGQGKPPPPTEEAFFPDNTATDDLPF